MNFEPQAVAPISWKTWCREALALTGRRPAVFVALTLVLASLDAVPVLGNALQMIFLPLFLGLGCRLAAEADNGRMGWRFVSGISVRAMIHLVLFGVTPFAVGTGMAAILNTLPLPEPEPVFHDGPPETPWVPFESGLGLTIHLALWLSLSVSLIWTLAPLMALGDIPIRPACNQAVQALERNGVLLRLGLGSAGILFFGVLPVGLVIGGTPVVAVFPFLCCLMYVSYRHIWWDRPRNQPQRSQSMASCPATARVTTYRIENVPIGVEPDLGPKYSCPAYGSIDNPRNFEDRRPTCHH